MQGPAGEADGKHDVRNALAVVSVLANIMPNTNCCVPYTMPPVNGTTV